MTAPHNPARPDESAFCVPRIGPGPEGRAVYLETVAQWLAERDDLSLREAWDRLLDGLAVLDPWPVHWLKKGDVGYGQLMQVRDEWFATHTGAHGPAGRHYNPGFGKHAPPPPPAPCLGRGTSGFVAWLRKGFGSDDMQLLILAESEARRLWGWGSGVAVVAVAASLELEDVETWPQLVEWRLANVNPKNKRGPDWGRGAGKQLRILEAELELRTSAGAGKSAALNAMGRELGYTGAEPRKPLKKAIDAVRMRKATASSAAPSSDGVTIVRSGQKVPKHPKAA